MGAQQCVNICVNLVVCGEECVSTLHVSVCIHCVCMRVWCVCVLVLATVPKYQNLHSTSQVRTFLGSEAGPHNSKGLLNGQDVVLKLRLKLALGWVEVQGQG